METLINKELNTPQELKKSLAEIKNYKLVLPCCGRKNYVAPLEGKMLVSSLIEHSPSGKSNSGTTYFNLVKDESCNSKHLLEAFKLYAPEMYSTLANRHKDDLYFLSAGWGIVKASRKLPSYDITFKIGQGEPLQWLRPIYAGNARNGNYGVDINEDWLKNADNQFNDLLVSLKTDETTPIVIMAGKNYLCRFWYLMKDIKNPVHVFHRLRGDSNQSFLNKIKTRWNLYKIEDGITTTKTTWYYRVAIDYFGKDK